MWSLVMSGLSSVREYLCKTHIYKLQIVANRSILSENSAVFHVVRQTFDIVKRCFSLKIKYKLNLRIIQSRINGEILFLADSTMM